MEIGLNLPERLVKLCQKVELSKEQIYLVGGAVRDLLMNREIHDWDLTTSAKPEKILSLFPSNSFYNNQFGTVGVVFDKEVWEITTFRTEANYDDFRRPKTIQWGKSLEEDLQRLLKEANPGR
jgi:tRNA nucleotidyltransferase/poly(A) polymerase